MFVLELEHLQEELQGNEAEKENRPEELQRSTARSRRGRRQQGESQQEDPNVSVLTNYWSMLYKH